MKTAHDARLVEAARIGTILAVLVGLWCCLASPSRTLAVQAGDVEPNEVVDLRDLLTIRNTFGQTGAPGFIGSDVNPDGIVDNADLLVWRQNFPFVGTVGAPYLNIFNPVDGSIIGDRWPTVVIDYSPTSLNVDPSTLQVSVDGMDRSAEAIRGARNAVLLIDQPLGDGPHSIQASIQDIQGTMATAQSDFQVTTITLLPKATPMSGPAPLTVLFTPDVIWADNPPAHYLWDFDNNGTYDNGCIGCFDASARPDIVSRTFNEEGVQTIKFTVYRGPGLPLVETTLTVAVTESYASVSPSNGSAPLTVFLHGIAADLSDPITLYEWDFDYSGSFSPDYASTTSPNTIHLYSSQGTYHPVFRTTHTSGAVVEHPIIQGDLQVTSANAPLAIAAAAQGSDALTVNFSGSGSDDGAITLYEWDFDNDGTYDFSSPSTGIVSHTYPTAGVKLAALRVTDDQANSTVDRVRIETYAPATLEVLDDTVKPVDGETVVVRTTLTIESTVNLFIRTRDGRVLRTLVDGEVRAAGTYDDLWDGRDFRFEPLHPGAYYAVLEYTYPGRTDTVDLTETTGGTHYFAPKTPPTVTTFDALADNPLPMRFQITSASRASLYILPGGSNRADTMFDNLPLGAGNYEYFWAGFNAAGQFATGGTYLWSVNAWTLADNVVIVQGQPAITNIQITPNQLSPSDRPPGSATALVDFNLSDKASVLVNIVNMERQKTLRAFQLVDLPAGANSFIWDGKTADGEFVSPGFYRLSMLAVDDFANLSIEREGLMEIRY